MSRAEAASTSRRGFLRTVGRAAAAGVAAPMIVPASALGRGGAVAPSERITLGVIGTGNQGFNDLRSFLRDERVVDAATLDFLETTLGFRDLPSVKATRRWRTEAPPRAYAVVAPRALTAGGLAPSAERITSGVPPTLPNARTGEFTPPGVTFLARSNHASLCCLLPPFAAPNVTATFLGARRARDT